MTVQEIDGDDYRAVYRATGLSPNQWDDLQADNRHGYDVSVYPKRCLSVWCPNCSSKSFSNKRIQHYFKSFQWETTRHVIVTVSRAVSSERIYRHVQRTKRLSRFPRRISNLNGKYLWVLEWHHDGYPHWHIMVENEGMIGKKKIEKEWKLGLVWEQQIKSAHHWASITGYHEKAGYLGGNKKHQIKLPDYLEGLMVRKFGTNIPAPNPIREREKPTGDKRKTVPRRTKRPEPCCSQTTIRYDNRWAVVDHELNTVLSLFEGFQETGFRSFKVPSKELKGALNSLLKP